MNQDKVVHGYRPPRWMHHQAPMVGQTSGTWGAYTRQELGLAGSTLRMIDNPDLVLTGNDSVFGGVARIAYGAGGAVGALFGLGTQQETARAIESAVDDVYSGLLTDYLGYTPAKEPYEGPVPEFLGNNKAEQFLYRVNAESTKEGRQAILKQVYQEQRDKETLSRASVGKLLLVGLASLPFDESFWIDLYATKGALKLRSIERLARMHKIVGAAGIGAMGAGVSGGIREAVLYQGQYTRTPEEVLQNIKIEAAFGGIMGAAVGTMSTAYRAAVRARYGADNVHDAVVDAQESLTRNLIANPDLQRRMRMISDAFQAGRTDDISPAMERRIESALDDYLDGANKNTVELVGLRKGSWGNALLNKAFFLTPNIRFATSSLDSARGIIDNFTYTGIAKEGGGGNASLERLKILLEAQQDASRMEVSDLFGKAQAEGANIKNEEVFDSAVEMVYRRHEVDGGDFDVPDLVQYRDMNSSQTVNIMESDEALNPRAKKAISEAAKKFAEEQRVYDNIAVSSGLFNGTQLTDIKRFYKEVHGENFVHRIIDRDTVLHDKEGAVNAVMAGFADLKIKEEPRLRQEIQTSEEALARLEGLRSNVADEAALEEQIAVITKRKQEAEATLEGLDPNRMQAESVVESWAASADGYIKPSLGQLERTVLIKDEFIEPYLIKSVEAQRSAFYTNTGIRSVAFRKLASKDNLEYVSRSNDLDKELSEIREQLKQASDTDHVQRLQNRVKDIAEEQDIINQSSRLLTDVRLAHRMTDAQMRSKLQEIRTLKRQLLEASRAKDKARYNALVTKFNKLSKEFVDPRSGGYKIADTGKSEGNIADHKDLLQYRFRGNKYENVDDQIMAAMDIDPRVKDTLELIESIAGEAQASKNRIFELETGSNNANKNFRVEATLQREVMEKGNTKAGLKELQRLTKDMQVINERLFGNRGKDAASPLGQLGPLMKNYNFLTSMGGVTFSSVPDIAMGVFTSGVGPYISTLYRYTHHAMKSRLKNLPPDQRYFDMDLIYSLEANATGARIREIMHFQKDGVQSYSRRERGKLNQLENLSKDMSNKLVRYQMLGAWNGFFKAVNGGAAASRIGRVANKLGTGRNPSKSDKRFLSMLRLDEADVRDMDKLYKHFGESETTGMGSRYYYAQSQNWTKGAAGLSSARVFELRAKLNTAISMNADLSIITPGVGSLPNMVDRNEEMSMVFQFKRFFFTATENLVLPMAQRVGTGDLQAVTALGGLLLAGGMVTAGKSAMKGEDPFPHLNADMTRNKRSTKDEYYNNIVSLVWNSVDRSGILGILAEPMQLMSKIGYDPIQIMTGNTERLGRAVSKPAAEILVGPSLGKLQTIFDAATSTVGLATGLEPLTASATKDYMALMPYQNLLPFTLLANVGFTALEASDKASQYNSLFPDMPSKSAADFYYDQFKFIEHRIAPMFAPVDYSGYNPRTAIVQ